MSEIKGYRFEGYRVDQLEKLLHDFAKEQTPPVELDCEAGFTRSSTNPRLCVNLPDGSIGRVEIMFFFDEDVVMLCQGLEQKAFKDFIEGFIRQLKPREVVVTVAGWHSAPPTE
jgi:hypothetical protein